MHILKARKKWLLNELVKSLGAERANDYVKADFTASGEKYDIVFDSVAKSSSYGNKIALSMTAIHLTTVPSAGSMTGMLFTSFTFGL